MQVEADTTAEINQRERIWFFPNKFWQATKGMPERRSQQVNGRSREVCGGQKRRGIEEVSLRFCR